MRRHAVRYAVILLLLGGMWILGSRTILGGPNENGSGFAAIELNALLDWRKRNGLHRTLRLGEKGSEVVLLQQALRSDPDVYPDGPVSGFFGEATLQAVRRFQEKKGLPPSGIVGEKTRQVVNTSYYTELCPSRLSEGKSHDRFMTDLAHGSLPSGYVPPDLVDISSRVRTVGTACLVTGAADALEKLFQAANAQGISLAVTSGFRNEEIQRFVFDYWTQRQGRRAWDFVAEPGRSEHQLGTAVDLTGETVHYRATSPEFHATPEGRWLAVNAHRFGFALSYPKGKKDVTGYEYEPWHFRYVGPVIAERMQREGQALTEYLNQK